MIKTELHKTYQSRKMCFGSRSFGSFLYVLVVLCESCENTDVRINWKKRKRNKKAKSKQTNKFDRQ